MEKRKYQLIIVGAGPAGLTAAIYAKRAGIDTLLLEKLSPGGQAQLTGKIENYPGFPKPISGQKLMEETVKQVENLKVELKNEEVERVEDDKEKKVYTDAGSIYQALALIVATGSDPMKLEVPGEKEFTGKGVSYCATCDAPFFRGEDVLVVGGGNTAIEEALYLTNFAKKVYLVHRRNRLRAEKILQDRVFANPKIEIIWHSVLKEIYGKGNVRGAKIKDLKSENIYEFPCRGVFIFVGLKPNTYFLKNRQEHLHSHPQDLVKMDENGFIITNEDMETNVRGIFACGDVRKNKLKQIVVACGEGAQAAFAARKYIEELTGTSYQ